MVLSEISTRRRIDLAVGGTKTSTSACATISTSLRKVVCFGTIKKIIKRRGSERRSTVVTLFNKTSLV